MGKSTDFVIGDGVECEPEEMDIFEHSFTGVIVGIRETIDLTIYTVETIEGETYDCFARQLTLV